MLPRPETFAVAMRELGVNQDKHLGTEVNTNISMHVSRLRIAIDAVMAKKMQAIR